MLLRMRGEQIKAAREAAGMTQELLARAVGVSPRTVGNWERGATVPKNRMGRLEAMFGTRDDGDRLLSASDVELLAELMRRAAVRG